MQATHLFELEKRLVDPSVRKSPKELEALLAPDFAEFGCSGKVWTRDTIVKALISGTSSCVDLEDFKSIQLAEDVMLVTYKSRKKNEDGSPFASLRSSIWKRNDGRWQMIFHQGTKTDPN